MKLNNLQILRGISALMVCCFHFRKSINFESIQLGDILFKKGSIGVPVFFVISGFIITYTTQKLDVNAPNILEKIKAFYKKRIIRIVPLYYLLTFSWMIAGGSFLTCFYSDHISKLICSLLFFPQRDSHPILYVGWSLNYEMFFYLLFGISLLFKKQRYIFLVAFYSAFFILTQILAHLFNSEDTQLLKTSGFLNLFFVPGILFAIILDKISIPRNRTMWISAFGILFFILHFFDIIVIKNSLIVLLIVSLFVLSFLLFDYSLHVKGNKFLVFLGDISYSLYLVHPFVELFLGQFKLNGYINILYFILKFFLAIALAAFLYYLVEKKITQYLKLKLNA